MLDHRFQGKPVFPAVEAMQALATSAVRAFPDVDPMIIEDARFDKFLFIDPMEMVVNAFNDLEILENGRVRSTLVTRKPAGTSGMTRTKAHVTLCFSTKEAAETAEAPKDLPDPDMVFRDGFEIPADRLYAELVPFGPAYQNVKDAAILSKTGAAADVLALLHYALDGPLGSPFPLDAAFHVACAWGQRHAGVVAFPVGLAKRRIVRPARPGERYRVVVRPVGNEAETLVFDMAIYDAGGAIREWAGGVRMRDVSGGRLKPPDWVVKT